MPTLARLFQFIGMFELRTGHRNTRQIAFHIGATNTDTVGGEARQGLRVTALPVPSLLRLSCGGWPAPDSASDFRQLAPNPRKISLTFANPIPPQSGHAQAFQRVKYLDANKRLRHRTADRQTLSCSMMHRASGADAHVHEDPPIFLCGPAGRRMPR
jgi:hypothetical protein